MARHLFTQGEFRVLDVGDSIMVARIGFDKQYHGHVKKANSKGKNKGIGTIKKLLQCIDAQKKADTFYLREFQRRLLTEDEYRQLRDKRKPAYYNTHGK